MFNRRPIEPLTLDEIQQACDFLKEQKLVTDDHRFSEVSLDEPPQSAVINHPESCHRIAYICVLNSKLNETFEAKVDLTNHTLIHWQKLPFDKPPYGQARIMHRDYEICDRVVKSNTAWRKALKNRGLTDDEIDLVQVDPFAPGYFDIPEEKGKRLVVGVSYYRKKITDNAYANPIEGVIAVVDLIDQHVLRLVDDGLNTPIPRQTMNYDADSIYEKQYIPKPIEITQPQGPNFKVDGWTVSWLGWEFNIGYSDREGVLIHQAEFLGRRIFYRYGLNEMVAPYGDPSKTRLFHAALDGGENGFGSCANHLKLGCDCVGHIRYFDVATVDENGNTKLMKQVICLHEEDNGILLKHTDTRTGMSVLKRNIRLIVSFFTTIDNYDYRIDSIFNMDGTFEATVTLTGILQTKAIYPGIKEYDYGAFITRQLVAPIHQHLFGATIMMWLGEKMRVKESEFISKEIDDDNPDGIAFCVKQRLIETEDEPCYANAKTQRSWIIYNPAELNDIGDPVGYQLIIPETPLLLAHEKSSIARRAKYATRSLWITPYPTETQWEEKYATARYPNQRMGIGGIPESTEQKRSIVDEPLALLVVFGKTHMPKKEEVPIMNGVKTGFMLTPYGFFNRNPVFGIPASHNELSVKQEIETPSKQQVFQPPSKTKASFFSQHKSALALTSLAAGVAAVAYLRFRK